jgi:ABC-type multidrug transport system fused ATPase/permease subunit
MKTLNKLIFLLSHKDRRQGILLLTMILIMAFFEMIGVVSILPFIAVISNPNIIETNKFLISIFNISKSFGVETNNQFLYFLGILVMIMLVTSLSFKAITVYFQLKFTSMCQYRIAKNLITKYLNQPYSWILNRHSADLGKTILSEVGVVVSKGLKPMINLITQAAITFTLVLMLAVVNLKLAIIIGCTFSFFYFVIYKLVRGFLNKIGSERLKANEFKFKIVIEAFGAFKALKVSNLELSFVKKFSKHAKAFAKYQASSQIVAQIPRYVLEAIAFGGILTVILFYMGQSGSFNEIIPLIALYAFAGYRLMPALQHIYSNITYIRAVGPSLDKMYKDLKTLQNITHHRNQNVLSLNKSITLSNIYYNYPNSSKTTLKDINLNILANTTVGIVGTTGSGKTTTVDIILGLLRPQKGILKIDDIEINENNYHNWQKSIGYVPQDIYLSDETIAANIAFGLDINDISQLSVEHAAKIANIHNFINNELPLKYKTIIGERGVRLSGGQRQRIGIARALYHNPKILILDEATSSLDDVTEKTIMEEVNKLRKDITIIMIAHRLSTVKNCDNIYILENGKIKNQGSFKKLINDSDLFQEYVSNFKKN